MKSSKSVSVSQSILKKPQVPQKVPYKSILSKKQTGGIKITYEGEDLTPETLNPLLNEGCKLVDLDEVIEEKTVDSHTTSFLQSTSRFHTELHKQQIYAETQFRQSYNTSFVDDVVIEPERKLSISVASFIKEDDFAPVQEELSETGTVYGKMPSHISLILKETNTFYLLELPSKTVDKNSEEGTVVEAENSRYEYLTEGKGRNRRMINAEVQTVKVLLKTRATEAERIHRKHNHAFASEWDMYDSYEMGAKEEPPVSTFTKHKVDFDGMTDEDIQFYHLLHKVSFQQALCVTERLLANNNFNEEQKSFRGLNEPGPENIEFKYRLRVLWTYANGDTSGKMPRFHKKTTDRIRLTQEKLNTALDFIKEGRSIRSVAENLGISRSALHRHVQKRKVTTEVTPYVFMPNTTNRQVFTVPQEVLLRNYLKMSSKIQYGLTNIQARKLAYQYAKQLSCSYPKQWDERYIAGREWLVGFMNRSPDLSLRSPESTSLSRATSFNKENIKTFFNNLEDILSRYSFGPQNIYNADETAFTTVHKPPKVIAAKGQKQVGQATSAERGQLVTMCNFISATSNTVPPVFIYPRVKFVDHMLRNGPLGSLSLAHR